MRNETKYTVAGLLILLLVGAACWERASKGQNDFAGLYAGAKLVGTPELYDRAANLKEIARNVGVTMETVVFTRPPFYAVFLKPLTLFPFRIAYLLFTLMSAASIAWFAWRFSRDWKELPLYATMSIPFITVLLGGQDTSFLMALIGFYLIATRSGRNVLAGFLLTLCAFKFHLFMLIPLVLLIRRQWRTLIGGIIGTGFLLVVSVVGAGLGSFAAYYRVLRDPWINPPAEHMPNLHGMLGNIRAELAVSLLVALTVAWIAWKTSNEIAFAAALIGGILLSYHASLMDLTVLYPAAVILLKSSKLVPLRSIMALVLTPVASVLILMGYPGIPVAGLLLILSYLTYDSIRAKMELEVA